MNAAVASVASVVVIKLVMHMRSRELGAHAFQKQHDRVRQVRAPDSLETFLRGATGNAEHGAHGCHSVLVRWLLVADEPAAVVHVHEAGHARRR